MVEVHCVQRACERGLDVKMQVGRMPSSYYLIAQCMGEGGLCKVRDGSDVCMIDANT